MADEQQQPQQAPQPVAPQIVYQQKPFPWLGMSQAVILVLMLVIVRREFMGAAQQSMAPPVSPTSVNQTYNPVPAQFQKIDELSAEIKALQDEVDALGKQRAADTIAIEKMATQNKELERKVRELSSLHKDLAATTSSAVQKNNTLEKQLKDLESKQRDTHRQLEKLSIRVLARDGLSPKTVGSSKSIKNRLVGYKKPVSQSKSVVKKPNEPVPTAKTPRIVHAYNSKLVSGSVGEPPIPDFASKWMKEWNTTISHEKDQLKRRAFIYKMLSHPQSKQGIMVYLKAMDDSDPVVRNFAVTALRDATGKDFGYSPSAPRQQRLQGIKAWKTALLK